MVPGKKFPDHDPFFLHRIKSGISDQELVLLSYFPNHIHPVQDRPCRQRVRRILVCTVIVSAFRADGLVRVKMFPAADTLVLINQVGVFHTAPLSCSSNNRNEYTTLIIMHSVSKELSTCRTVRIPANVIPYRSTCGTVTLLPSAARGDCTACASQREEKPRCTGCASSPEGCKHSKTENRASRYKGHL